MNLVGRRQLLGWVVNCPTFVFWGGRQVECKRIGHCPPHFELLGTGPTLRPARFMSLVSGLDGIQFGNGTSVVEPY